MKPIKLNTIIQLFAISEDSASALFNWANVATVAGGVFTLLGVIGLFWFGGIKERYADEHRTQNEQKTAQAYATAETARATAAAANERAAAFERDTAALNLELAKIKNDRHLTDEQKSNLTTDLKTIGPHLVTLYAPNSDNETKGFVEDWFAAFKEANWQSPIQTPLSIGGGPLFPGITLVFQRTTDLPSWQLQFYTVAKKYVPDLIIGYDSVLAEDSVKLLFGPKSLNDDWKKTLHHAYPEEQPQFVPPEEERHLPEPPKPNEVDKQPESK